jgi:hypothetical protein
VGERRIRETAAVAVGIAVALVSWLLLRGEDDGATTPQAPSPGGPRIVSAQELETVAAEEGPIYWAGPRTGTQIEFSRRPQGGLLVRYLPPGAEPGDQKGHLTVATYRRPDGPEAVDRLARADGARATELDGGGRAVVNRGQPTNAYVAYRGEPVQIEVYDPEPGRAAALARAGRIVPVELR